MYTMEVPGDRVSESLQRAVLVAVPVVLVMQMARYEVIGVLGVRDGLVPTARPVRVSLLVPATRVRRRACRRVRRSHGD